MRKGAYGGVGRPAVVGDVTRLSMDFSAFHNQHDSRLHELIYLSILDEFHSQHEEGRRKVGSLTSKNHAGARQGWLRFAWQIRVAPPRDSQAEGPEIAI